MKLTIDQIQYIDTYVEKSGIEWFDLKIELVDHLADAAAQILEDNPKLPFEDAVTKAKIAFGTKGFRPLITNRTKQIEKSFYILKNEVKTEKVKKENSWLILSIWTAVLF